jgi:glycosyltransferase involved in cell wall biosynthesis
MNENLTPVPVLHAITRLIVGGAQENTIFTAALLDKKRFRVEVLAGPQTGSEGSLIEEVRARDIPLHVLPDLVRQVNPYHDLLALVKMIRLMKAGGYLIVHTHSSKAGVIGRLAARLAGVPIIVHTVHGWSFHDHMSPWTKRTYIGLERFTARFTNTMIIVTKRDIDKGIKAGIGQAEQYHLIRSAIPLEEFNPELTNHHAIRQQLGLPPDVPVLGNVGRFSPQKNPLDWVHVAAKIAHKLPVCRFLMVGDGPLRPQVEKLIQEKDLAGRVILTGLRRDIPQMLAAMNVFLLTSLWEGLPRVIPQAMAMRLPVVANRVDGIVEAIEDGVTGFLCPPGDLDCLASRCLELLQNREGCRRMGLSGREYALREFDLNKMASQIMRLYDQLITRSRSID